MVLVAVVVLGLSYATTYVLVRRALQENALSNLRSRTSDLQPLVKRPRRADRTPPASASRRRLAALKGDLRAGLQLTGLSAVLVAPDGTVRDAGLGPMFSLPATLNAADLEPQQLLAGQDVSGRRGNTVFLAIPARHVVRQTARDRRDRPRRRPRCSRSALAAARCSPGSSCCSLAAVVAVWLARRLTRPIREIERAAGAARVRRPLGPGRRPARHRRRARRARRHAQRDGRRSSSSRAAASARSCSRSRTTCARRSRRSAATPKRSPTARSTTPTPTRASAPRRSSAPRRRRLERLVRDLLDLSRLDSREFSLTPAPVRRRPRSCATRPRRSRRRRASSASTLHVAGAGALSRSTLDPERLAQIVANLIENALKYATSTIEVYAAPQRRRPASRSSSPTTVPASRPTDLAARVRPALHRALDARAVGRHRSRPRDRPRARRRDGRHRAASSARPTAGPGSSSISRPAPRASRRKRRSRDPDQASTASTRAVTSAPADRTITSPPGSTVRRIVAERDVAGRSRDGPDLLVVGDHHGAARERRVGAQPAQQPVDVAAAVDAAHQLLAEEASLRERHRVALEERLLRRSCVSSMSKPWRGTPASTRSASYASASISTAPASTRRPRAPSIAGGVARRARRRARRPSRLRTGTIGRAASNAFAWMSSAAGPRNASAPTSAERSSISTFTRIRKRFRPSASAGAEARLRTRTTTRRRATRTRAEVDDAACPAAASRSACALSPTATGSRSCDSEALQERRRVGARRPRRDHGRRGRHWYAPCGQSSSDESLRRPRLP